MARVYVWGRWFVLSIATFAWLYPLNVGEVVYAPNVALLLFGVAASIAKDVGVLGLRKFITQRQDQFGSAIKGTCSRISGIEGTETALLQWISSETFIGFFESIYEGERCPDTEIVNSFIKDGGFYLPIEAECI